MMRWEFERYDLNNLDQLDEIVGIILHLGDLGLHLF